MVPWPTNTSVTLYNIFFCFNWDVIIKWCYKVPVIILYSFFCCLKCHCSFFPNKHKHSKAKSTDEKNKLECCVPQSKAMQVAANIRFLVEKFLFHTTWVTVVEGWRVIDSRLSKHHHGIIELWDPWGMLLWRWSSVVILLNTQKHG